MLRKVQRDGVSNTPTETLDDYGLGGFNCEKCNNTGVIVTKTGLCEISSRECSCMPIRRSLRRIRNSGMIDMLERYTFENYQTPNKETERVKRLAEQFVDDEGWLYIFGRSGSGKTHICTAICSEKIKQGVEVYYMSWRDESVSLKSCITDTELYDQRIRKLKTVPVLYIDDFLKGGESEADIRLAFEIINARYNDRKLKTIISSEKDIESLLDTDEALGGRIYERAKAYTIKAPGENWRLR